MNVVVSNAESQKAFSKKTEKLPKSFLNKKIGETVSLDEIGLEGYVARITGGSDNNGFPMHPAIMGTGRRKIFSLKGIGFRQKGKGIRRRKSVAGNTVSDNTAQLNVVVTKEGKKPFVEFTATPKVVVEKKSVKEEMVEKSLAGVGDEKIAQEAKRIKKTKK